MVLTISSMLVVLFALMLLVGIAQLSPKPQYKPVRIRVEEPRQRRR